MDYRLALMCGTDLPVPECQLIVHQPRIKEISFIGEQDFFIGAQCLCLNKTMFIEDKNLLSNTNNFQIFMTIMHEKETQDKKKNVMQVLNLLFPTYKVLLTPTSLAFISQEGGENITIDESNFEFLQVAFRAIFCANEGPMDQQAFNPANEKAKEIADKLMRGRKRIAAQQSQNNSIFSQYLSVLTVGLESMSLFDLTELTMYQLYDLIERFGLYTAWDIDIKSRLAGGKPDKEPDNWMKNIHNH